MQPKQILMGIDPGFDRVGWAIGSKTGSSLKILSYGCIVTNPQESYMNRLSAIQSELSTIVEENAPLIAGVESLFFTNNQKTAIRVAQARGVILAVLLRKRVQVVEMTPLQVKSAVTGHGQSDKKAMEKMVRLQCALPDEPIIDDTIDAIGIVLALNAQQSLLGQ